MPWLVELRSAIPLLCILMCHSLHILECPIISYVQGNLIIQNTMNLFARKLLSVAIKFTCWGIYIL